MKKTVVAIFGLLFLLGIGLVACAVNYPELEQVAKPPPESFDRGMVKRGETLVAMGGCQECHTQKGGRPLAGGLALPTPFGTITTTNITPDPQTGIGAWPEAAFIRAMREGVDNKGNHLYPAFPYDYYTKVTDDDLKAIYAYLMTREAVASAPAGNALSFPFNQRFLLAGWKALFHRPGAFKPDPAQNAEWNRGAYLVEGLGHCGACHSPRNLLGAAAKTGTAAYGGGFAEGWWAPPLNGAAPGQAPWTVKSLVDYLIDGWDAQHGIAAGPMTAVVNGLKDQSEDDVFAIAAYLMSRKVAASPAAADVTLAVTSAAKLEWGHPEAPPAPSDPVLLAGAKVFESQCSTCHKAGGSPVPLALTASMNAPDATNLVAVTLHGIQPPRGSLSRSMPGRAGQISDKEMTALAQFMRVRFTKQPAWTGLDEVVRKVRQNGP